MEQKEEEEMLQAIFVNIQKNPSLLSKIIEACTLGMVKNNNELRDKILKKDKAITVLFEHSNLGSDLNLEDTASELTNNAFNGIEKIYTIEDVKLSIKK